MKNRLVLVAMLMGLAAIIFTACAQPAYGDYIRSSKGRVTSPVVAQGDQETLIDGNNRFALRLYQALRKEGENLFYSPYSISVALAMTYAGARGETAKQMVDALHYNLENDRLHSAFNWLDIELASRGEGAQGKDGEGFRLNIVNAIWGQKGYEFLSGFLDILAENYDAGLRPLDFSGNPDQSRVIINEWVSEQTEGKIENLIPQGLINPLTRLVLTNAIYFNAAWQYPFPEGTTTDGPFHLLGGTDVNVPMMRQTESFGYTVGDTYEAVELLYDGGELLMTVLLPKEGQFRQFSERLNSRLLDDIIGNMQYREVALEMPRFEYESSWGLKDVLSAMGMAAAFSDRADFSGMTGNRDLFIKEIVHKAFVSVDEAGTEAAAATAVMMQLTAAPAEPVKVTINRPFIFLIRDIETGAILFLGHVVNPAV